MPAPDFLEFACQLADAARRETLGHGRGAIAVEDKSGGGPFDPVTAADRAAEAAIRALIDRHFPDHGVIGEEFGDTAGGDRHQWLIDPIDGTRSYICGLPSWTTLIALLDGGEPVLGIVDAPAIDERYVGTQGGSWMMTGGTRHPLQAGGCTRLAEARLATTDPFLFAGEGADAFGRLREAARVTRYGLDAYAYARLAAGSLDLVVECGLKAHDYAALVPLVRGAGGMFGDWDGGQDFTAGNVIAAATPQLYLAVVEIMRTAR